MQRSQQTKCFFFKDIPPKLQMDEANTEHIAHCFWALAEESFAATNVRDAILCLEAICQSQHRFYPQIEVKTRLRLADWYLKYTNNVDHAKHHLSQAVSFFNSNNFLNSKNLIFFNFFL